ncbi:sugar transferase [Sphingomonas sp. RB56-2]|uniref:Sugar transferase n=1 Tax=Sphingomonas brevis TaxID=2908206 RepID=A0ABT0S689_9SPHN|nr:sugar transferase [Sphingomonas brevis]MCL6739905.1 sugar transferase [Sphingomonas brevis]
MLHSPPTTLKTQRRFIARQRFNALGAMVAVALLPFLLRAIVLPQSTFYAASINALMFNALAVVIAFWTRLSIETYPGNRSTHVILPSIVLAHATIVTILLLARLPYDRLALVAGFVAHILWGYGLYFSVQRYIRYRIAIVPFGDVDRLRAIDTVEWREMQVPALEDAAGCDGLVADFAAPEMPPEWEALLADAAVEGRMVYQVKQLYESLTGRVEVDHLRENSFGSLVPARGYFHLKALLDLMAALVALPVALPVLAGIALAIRLDSPGPAIFRQRRIGQAGLPFYMLKFRTMAHREAGGGIEEAITSDRDPRITRVGARLRKSRLDELPQIFNILAGQMSWIGPRPEAEALSIHYSGEIPFYRYRHVVRPGITGWAQVNQGHVASVDEVDDKLKYDFYYVKYFSAWLDLLIVFRTIRTMTTGFGSR